jgi:hypothetical protein
VINDPVTMARPVDPFIFPSNQSGADLAAPLSPSSRKPIPLRLGSGSQQIRRWREKDSNFRFRVRNLGIRLELN